MVIGHQSFEKIDRLLGTTIKALLKIARNGTRIHHRRMETRNNKKRPLVIGQ